MSVIRVFSYEPGTKVCKQKRTLEFEISEKQDDKLEEIRKLLLKHKVLGAREVRNPFCDTTGAEVSDQMSIGVYLNQLVGKVEEETENDEKYNKKSSGKTDETADAKGNAKEDIPTKPEEHVIPKFYYKKKKVQTKTDDATQEFLKKKLDLKLRSTPALSPIRAQLLQSAFKGDQWSAAPAAKLSVVAELTERDWSVIVRTNCLLSGQYLASEDIKNPTVERTPFSAFKIRNRKFDSYEIAAPAAPVGKGVSKEYELEEHDKFGELLAHIPRFRVDDSSYVTVIETQNSLQSSMAKSSFNQSSIEASAGGGFFGVSASAKAGVFTKNVKNEDSTEGEERKQMHVIYSFPRVTVYLDAESLELTDEVKKDILEVRRRKTKDMVEYFGKKYGRVFSQRVKLGGRLMSSHDSSSVAKENKAESENSLKAAAAASISGWGVSVSAEASHATGSKVSTSETESSFASNMSWEATGGNTVLCNDPPRWCGTVGNFRHWRIVEQNDIIPLTKLISTFEGFESTESDFHRIAGTDIQSTGGYMHYKIQLIDSVTDQRLVALPRGDNPLRDALQKGQLRETLKKLGSKVQAGSVHLDTTRNQEDASYWVLERWVEKGQTTTLSYRDRVVICNPQMPEGKRYLSLAEATPWAISGFLYPGDKDASGSFILEKPHGEKPSSGPIKSGDTVVLRVWSRSNPKEEKYVMRADKGGMNQGMSRLIDQIPAFARTLLELRPDHVRRLFRFRIEIEAMWPRHHSS